MNDSYYDRDYFLEGNKSGYGGRYVPYVRSLWIDRERIHVRILKESFGKFKTVLVLGCARGYLVEAFHERGIDAWGIDISAWAITNSDCSPVCRQYLSLGDCCDLSKYRDKQFDLVVAFDVMEHIPIPDLYKALDEACRVASKFIAIHVPLVDKVRIDKTHVSLFWSDWWIGEIRKRGFEVIYETKPQLQADGIISAYFYFRRVN